MHADGDDVAFLNFKVYYNALIRGAFFTRPFIILSHAFELSFDVDPTNRAVLACNQPLIHAIAMEQMHTWQAAEINYYHCYIISAMKND